MSNKIEPADMDVFLLCGGRGERLKPLISDRPKPMAELNGKPLLDILLENLTSFGFQRFILGICYMPEFIRKYYQHKKFPFTLRFSEEKQPLGTAGALKNAQKLIKSNPFLVMNADSLCNLDFKAFLNFYQRKKALFSLALAQMRNAQDYGKVMIDKTGRIAGFNEKQKSKSEDNLINTGIYLFDRSIFDWIPSGKNCSLEYDIFPKIAKNEFWGFVSEADFIDIGTPERFRQAGNYREIAEKILNKAAISD